MAARRPRTFLLFPLALSPRAWGENLQLHKRRIDYAIKYEGLKVYSKGKRTRRILTADIVEWVRKHWKEEA